MSKGRECSTCRRRRRRRRSQSRGRALLRALSFPALFSASFHSVLPMTLYLGAHTIDNGGIDMAARRAGAAGMKALQIFTAIPKYYGDKVSIRPERVERFKTALAA